MDKIDKHIERNIKKRYNYISDHIGEIKDEELLDDVRYALFDLWKYAEDVKERKQKINELL